MCCKSSYASTNTNSELLGPQALTLSLDEAHLPIDQLNQQIENLRHPAVGISVKVEERLSLKQDH